MTTPDSISLPSQRSIDSLLTQIPWESGGSEGDGAANDPAGILLGVGQGVWRNHPACRAPQPTQREPYHRFFRPTCMHIQFRLCLAGLWPSLDVGLGERATLEGWTHTPRPPA